MSDDVVGRIARCLAEVLAIDPSGVNAQTRIMVELGADSLDLVELMYLVEEEFGVELTARDMSLTAQLGLPEQELHHAEVLTPRALELLRERFPDAAEVLVPGATRRDLGALVTVGEVARTVRRMRAEGGEGAADGADASSRP